MTAEGCKGQRKRLSCTINCLELILIKNTTINKIFFFSYLLDWFNSCQKPSSLTANSTCSSEALLRQYVTQTQAGCEKPPLLGLLHFLPLGCLGLKRRSFSLTLKPCSTGKMGRSRVFRIVPNQERTEDFRKTGEKINSEYLGSFLTCFPNVLPCKQG